MKKTGIKQKIKFIFKIIFSLALIIFSCHIFVDLFEEEIFSLLVNRIERATDEKYLIKYEKVDLNLFKRWINLTQVSISPTEDAIHKKAPDAALKGPLLKASIPLLRIEGISILSFIFSRSINIKSLSINNAELILIKIKKESESKEQLKKVKSINKLQVHELNLNKIAFKIVERDTNNPILDVPEISLQLTKLKANLGKRIPQKIPFKFELKKSFIKNPTFYFPDGFYTLNAQRLDFSPSDSSFQIQSFSLLPLYERYEFSKKRGHRCNRITLSVDQIIFKDISGANLFREKALFVPLIAMNNPHLTIFRDKNIPKNPVKKAKKFPAQLINDFNYKLKIDRIDIHNGNIDYMEHAVNKKQPGKLIFEQIDAHIKNITNVAISTEEKPSLELTATTKIMGKSNFTTQMHIPIGSNSNDFTFSGSLDHIKMKEFNAMLVTNANIKIESGTVKKLNFSAHANDQRISGKMTFLYKDLKLVLLKKGRKQKRSRMLSFLTNQLIYNDNPRKGKPYRLGKILYKKVKPISFFRYIWKSLLSGIKSSISKKLGHTLF
jgi:hypothetical protein